MRRTYILLSAVLFFAIAIPCYAEQAPYAQQESRLTYLYSLRERNPEDTSVQDSIDKERKDLRDIVQEELLQTIAAPVSDELSESDPMRALDRQQAVVDSLRDRIAERSADLDLLNTEEHQVYLNPPTETGATEPLRLTKSHAELLAKRAVFEERIAALEAVLSVNVQRLEKLQMEQRREQFAFLRSMALYAVVIFLVWLFEHIVRTAALTRIRRPEYRYAAIKIFTAAVYTIVTLWLLSALLVRHPSIITSFAIIGAGLAIALQDVVKDILGWMMIRQHRLFTQGQRVTIGIDTGEIIDIGMLRTKMLEVGIEGNPVLERTGKILSLPNAAVLTQRVTNHSATSDFVRAEMHVTVTFDSKWEKAEQILLAILEEQTGAFDEKDKRQYALRTKIYFVPKQSSGPAVHVDIAADGIEFTLRFSVPIGEKRPISTQIAKEILRQFDKHKDIELAYKTSRIISSVYEPRS